MASSTATTEPCTDVEKVTRMSTDYFLVEIKDTVTVDHFNRNNGRAQSKNHVPVMAGIICIRAVDSRVAPVLTLDGQERADTQLDPVNEFVFNPKTRHPGGPSHLRERYESQGFKTVRSFVHLTAFSDVKIHNLPSDALIEVTGYNIKFTCPFDQRGFQWAFM